MDINLLREEQKTAWPLLRDHADHTPWFGNIGVGIGKTTLIAGKAVHESKRTQLPILLVFPTHALIRQFLASEDDLNRGGIIHKECGVWLPKSAFASASKCAKLGIELEYEGELSEEVLARCKDDFEALSLFDIGMDKHCSHAELAIWKAHKDDLSNKKYILCTQSAWLISIWSPNYFGFEGFGYVLVDEAHLLPQMAGLFFNRTVKQDDIEWLKTEKCKLDFKEPTQESIDYLLSRCEQMRKTDKNRSDDLQYRLSALSKNFSKADRHSFLNIGGLANGDWKIEFKRPANIISWSYEKQPIALLSGTMTMDEDESFTSFARDIGAKEAHKDSCYIESENFGIAYFIQAKMEPDQLRDYLELRKKADDCNERFAYQIDLDLCVASALEAAKTGPVLVLTASSADTVAIAEKLGDSCIYQKPKQSMKFSTPQYESSTKTVFVCHGGWEGLDIKVLAKRFKHIIITRIPYAYPSELLDIPFCSYQMVCMRKLRQGLGRGIRRADDVCTYWILDKRFPVRGHIAAEYQINNDQFSAHVRLADCIWKRFRNPMFKDYGHSKAKLVKLDGRSLKIG